MGGHFAAHLVPHGSERTAEATRWHLHQNQVSCSGILRTSENSGQTDAQNSESRLCLSQMLYGDGTLPPHIRRPWVIVVVPPSLRLKGRFRDRDRDREKVYKDFLALHG